MKKYLLLASVLMVVLGFLMYWEWRDSQNSPNALFHSDISRREAVYQQWLAAIEQNPAIMRDAEAQEVLKYIKDSKMARPHQNILEVPNSAEAKVPALSIVVLFPEDARVGSRWQKIISIPGSQFVGDLNAIAIKAVPNLSPTEMAFSLLHEGRHALDFKQGKFGIYGMKEDACAEELRAWTFQTKLMEEAGGSAYQKLLQEKIATLNNYGDARQILAPDGPYDPRLDNVFGETASDEERTLRQSAFYINAAFDLMNTQYPAQAQNQNLRIICSLYSSWGVYGKE